MSDSLPGVVRSILVDSAPRPRVRMREVARVGTRLRRMEDGLVFVVVQVHRADRVVELSQPLAAGRFVASFASLRSEYELLLSLRSIVR